MICRSAIGTILTPSINTSPASGCNKPIKCLSSTLLPPPLRPMITTDSPSFMHRLTRSKSSCAPKLLCRLRSSIMSREHAIQQKREENVADQDADRGKHHGLGCGASDALSAFAACHAFVTTDHGDDRTKDDALDQPRGQIGHASVHHHVVPCISRVSA